MQPCSMHILKFLLTRIIYENNLLLLNITLPDASLLSECSHYHLNKQMKPAVFNIKLPSYLKIKLSGVSAYV